MKTKRYIDKNFYIVRHFFDKGDIKEFSPKEIVRNDNDKSLSVAIRSGIDYIPEHQLVMSRTIPVIIKGSFFHRREGQEDRIKMAGDGAWQVSWKPTDTPTAFVAAEDDSQFDCIIPRDRNADWTAKIHNVQAKDKISIEASDKYRQYIYVCAGSVKIGKLKIPSPTVVDISPAKSITVNALEDNTMFVEIWIYGD